MTEMNTEHCSAFLDKLEPWLAGEYEAEHMGAHHDSCAACRMEARLARAITGILHALPEPMAPEIRVPARGINEGHSLVERLLNAWRQPLVLVPAFALLLAAVVVVQLRTPATVVDPDVVVIDGTEYTREEIQKAAADLETVLRYLDKYGNYPAQVISAELEGGRLPQSEPEVEADDAPTI